MAVDRTGVQAGAAIQAGSLVMELHPWYGSAAVMMINEVHAKLQKPAAGAR